MSELAATTALTPPRALADADFAATEARDLRVNPLERGVFMLHQRQWLEDQSPLKLCQKGRRTGITFAQAWDDTLVAAASRSAGGDDCFYIGDTKEKGLEYIGYVRHFARCIGEQLKSVEEYLFEDKRDDGETRYITAYRARFASGFQVVGLSSRPANIRGLQGRVTVDEAAFHQDVRAVLAAVNALLIWGGRVRVISTHNGAGNPFNTLVQEARAGRNAFHLHSYTFDDAVANGLYERVCLKRGTKATEAGKAAWYKLIRASYGTDTESEQQELDCKPAEGGGAWLGFEVILSCEDADAGKPELYQGGACVVGNDIARRGDLWVAWVWERVGDVSWCREISILRNKKFAEHDAEIARLMQVYSVERLVMDQTGMGEKPVEDMQALYGWKVEGVVLSAETRLNVATVTRQRFEARELRIPLGDTELRNDLHKLKRVQGDTGHPRLVAESDEAGHADRFWAAALGIAGASNEAGIFAFYKRQVAASPAAQQAHDAIVARMDESKEKFRVKRGGTDTSHRSVQ